MKFGLLLPHFGPHVDPGRILAGAVRAEALGFDSVWVRDHLFLTPGRAGGEGEPDFLEALTVLAAVGASTSRLRLGTAALVPLRHPLIAASTVATLTQLVGPRVVLGVGGGSTDREFEVIGLGGASRLDLVLSSMAIMRRAWTGEAFSWSDAAYRFDEVAIRPRPAGGTVPFWYCGNTPRAARVAGELCEGWLPGRISLATLERRVATLAETAREYGRPRPVVGTVPATSIARNRAAALRDVDLAPLYRTANAARYWVSPKSGQFSTLDDLEGLLLWGTPEDVVGQCRRLEAAGVEQLVFDCRLSFGRWEEQMQLLADEVLPAFP